MSILRSIASTVPDDELPQAHAATMAAHLTLASPRRARAIDALYANSGVGSRRQVVTDPQSDAGFYRKATPEFPLGPTTGQRLDEYALRAAALASGACVAALRDAGVEPSDVTHIVTVSCTGFASPGVDAQLIEALALSPDTQRTNVGFMGCHGAVNGLRISDALARANPQACVLLCCVELCSLHFQYAPRNGAATANSLFGDGAAACVIAPNGDGPRLTRFGSRLFPHSSRDMGWRIGDHGFEMSLSARVPDLLREGVGTWVGEWLDGIGLCLDDVDAWVIHPGGPRIVEAVVDSLGLTGDGAERARAAAMGILAQYGNMSSPTILMMLERLLGRGVRGRVVALAFGPGLAGEASLLEV